MTRRERLERKLELRQEWADKREAKVAAVVAEGEKYRGDYAFNTQPGHIPERARLIAREDRAFGSGGDYEMARHHESKARGLERQLDRSIFSDDADAIAALEARIAEHEAERARWKAINSAARKGEGWTKTLTPPLTDREVKSIQTNIQFSSGTPTKPIPGYIFTNLAGRIRADKQRIEEIRRRSERTAAATAAGGVLIRRDGLYASVTFDEKPAWEVLRALKDAGFHWSGGSWHGHSERLATLEALPCWPKKDEATA